MCTSLNNTTVGLPNGNQRNNDGSLTLKRDRPTQVSFDRPANSTDVPLGEGMLDAARLSILSRRDRIRRAVEGQ